MKTVIASLLLAAGLVAAQDAVDTCVDCHVELDDELGEPAHLFAEDIHARQGLSCADCHGGHPGSDDEEASMDWDAGFVGAPERADIPAFCGRCHSDGALIRRYNPSLRIDQEALYHASFHGQRLAEGDDRVAVCSDCHGAHGILPANDPRSPVYAANVPATCGSCHADADHMDGYPIPTDQLVKYRSSVHGRPLLEGGDLSAPACNDCHGNHGAMPPGVKSLANVCGQCHPINNELVSQSPHRAAFESLGIAACKTCHGHHAIDAPTDDMVGQSSSAVCVQCHGPEQRRVMARAGNGAIDPGRLERGWEAAGLIRARLDTLRRLHAQADSVVGRAERAGMEVGDALYDLHEAAARLTRARSVLHAFDLAPVVEVTDEGLALAGKALAGGREALDDLEFRRRGLALSLLVIAVVGIALYAKIRSLD